MERAYTREIALDSYLYSDSLKNLKKNKLRPFVRNTLMVWHEAHNIVNDGPPLSRLAPTWENSKFKHGTKDLRLKQWSHKGIGRIMDLYNDRMLMSFNYTPFFFKYLQLQSFVLSKLNHSSSCLPLKAKAKFLHLTIFFLPILESSDSEEAES